VRNWLYGRILFSLSGSTELRRSIDGPLLIRLQAAIAICTTWKVKTQNRTRTWDRVLASFSHFLGRSAYRCIASITITCDSDDNSGMAVVGPPFLKNFYKDFSNRITHERN
jgi:hypothetical protein